MHNSLTEMKKNIHFIARSGAKTIVLGALCWLFANGATAQSVALKSEGLDSQYVETIKARAQKIVNGLQIADAQKAETVRNIIANRYFLLNEIHEQCAKSKRFAKDSIADGKQRQQLMDAAESHRDASLYKHHFEFAATLSLYLADSEVEQVKDGMTYGVVPKTYQAHLEMIPSLKEEEKAQILAWLKEAREFAMDAENSNKKHGWFGKYKGRINNWLTSRGYNLTQERAEWYKRIDAKKASEKK